MIRFKLVNYLVAFVVILSLNFILPRMMPGDPLAAIYGEEVLVSSTPQPRAELVERMALDRPWWAQLARYLASLLQGDFGYSYYYNAPVLKILLGALPWTLLLAGSSLILSTLLGIVLGIESGWRRGSKSDGLLLTGLMMLSGFPDFFVGTVLLLCFSISMGLMPLGGAVTPYAGLSGTELLVDILRHLALPLAALTLAQLAGVYLLTRNTMVTVLEEPYILMARAKGLRDSIIRYRHAARNSMLPVVTRTGVKAGTLFTGVLFIEVVFSYPGLGVLMQNALVTRDYPVLQGIFLIVSISVLALNFLTDLLYVKIDPRAVPAGIED